MSPPPMRLVHLRAVQGVPRAWIGTLADGRRLHVQHCFGAVRIGVGLSSPDAFREMIGKPDRWEWPMPAVDAWRLGLQVVVEILGEFGIADARESA